MIRYLRHKEIDTAKWDDCIQKSVNGMVYARSWYLNIVTPGWEALEQDDYSAVFPLPCASRCGIRYLRQPFFTQQLGLFSREPLSEEAVTAFLQAIPPRYRFAELNLNSFNRVNHQLFDTGIRRNHEMELVQSYEILSGRYSQNVKRNLRKAVDTGVMIRRKIEPEELIRLFSHNFGRKEGKLSYRDYMTINQLIIHSLRQDSGIVMGASQREGTLDAAAFILRDQNRYYFLFSATDYQTRDNGAMFLLIDTFIREHSNRPMILDFEGGHDPNLGRFYKSFGALETGYPVVRINRLSPLVKTGVKWIKKIRGK